MQLLNSPQTQLPLAGVSVPVLDSLQHIVTNVQIKSSFCISHPAYKPLEPTDEAIVRFQKMPLELQYKYLSLQLRGFLYGIYYNGSIQSVLAPDADDLAPPQNLENNTFLGVDLEFFDRLHQSNKGTGYFDPDWLVLRQEEDGSLAATKGGLTLHIERDRHLQPTEQRAEVGDKVAIRMPRNLIQNGFYMAVSNAGTESHSRSDQPLTIRIYFNFTPEGAVAVMESLTQQLNDLNVPFTFKTLYNPSDYKRYDSGVLYFDRSYYKVVCSVLQTIYVENQSYFQIDIPLFTKFLAPGLGLAEEPDFKFSAQESFGMNRCQILANALLEAQHQGDESPEKRMALIHQHFHHLGLDLKRPYLNASSEDIYTPLNI